MIKNAYPRTDDEKKINENRWILYEWGLRLSFVEEKVVVFDIDQHKHKYTNRLPNFLTTLRW